MSTIRVDTITNVADSGDVEVKLPLKIKEHAEPSAPTDGHGLLFIDSSDNKIKYRHTSVNSGNSVDLTAASTGAVGNYNNNGNNRVLTSVDSNTINGEAALTFDGSTLAVTGDATISDDLGLTSDAQKTISPSFSLFSSSTKIYIPPFLDILIIDSILLNLFFGIKKIFYIFW